MDQLIPLFKYLRDVGYQDWLEHDLYTWHWYFAIVLNILAPIAWWRLVDKKRLLEIVVYGLLINYIVIFIDIVGVEAVLWVYPDRLLPLALGLLPADYIFIPVLFMLIYQYADTWKSYLFVVTVVVAIIAFIVDPFLVKVNFYKLVQWKHTYSFIVFLMIAVTVRFLTEFLITKASFHKGAI